MKTKDRIKTRSNKGITLIALVITIIVLLILAAVTINALSGDNGILKRAKDAKEQTNEKNQEEMGKLDDYKSTIDQYADGTGGGSGNGGSGGGSSTNFTNIDTAKSNPAGAVPAGSTVIEPDASKGIVIKDKNNNEWVWIEVPKDTAFSGLTIDTTGTLTEQNYNDIKNKLIAYATTYREGKSGQGCNWTDEWYAEDGEELVTASTSNLTETQKSLTNGCGLTYDEYKTAYQKMLKSVYTYGGFWIGRYEAGIEGSITDLTKARTGGTGRPGGTTGPVSYDGTSVKVLKLATVTTQSDNTNTLPKAISQKDAIPYNWVTCSEAQSLAKEMTPNSNYTSSLMFGIQWDLVCKYLEEKGGLSVSDIKQDSSSWGNYCNAKIENITAGKYAILDTITWKLGEWTKITSAFTKSDWGDNSSVLLSTGISEYTKKMNIYNFASNEAERTLEKTSSSDDPCARRGGSCSNIGSDFPASFRCDDYTALSGEDIGFRPALYAN